MYIAFFRKTNF